MSHNNVFADSTINLTVTPSNAVSNIIPKGSNGTFASSNIATVSIATTNSTGYTLTIAAGNKIGNTGRLTGTTNTTKYLNSITSTISEHTFSQDTEAGKTYNNQWGFSPSRYCTGQTADTCINNERNTTNNPNNTTNNPNYLVSPKNTATPTIIDITTSANATAASYALSIGARATTETPKDSYTGDFMILASANAINYSIGFVDLTNEMPETIADSTKNDTVTLPSERPIKPYHVFTGWCSKPTTDNTCTDGTIYQPGSSYNIKTNEPITNLYAMWERVTNVLQNVDTWGDTLLPQVGNITYAYDNRDGRVYTVGRLADDRIWLLDNLAFSDFTLILNSNNTNLGVGMTATIKTMGVNGDHDPTDSSTDTLYNDSFVYYADKNKVSEDELSMANGWRIGAYYNFCAASAGTACGGRSRANYSICPAGWRLPTGGFGGEYADLYNAMGGTGNPSSEIYTNFRTALRISLPGYFQQGNRWSQNGNAVIWSSTASSSNYFFVSSDFIMPNGYGDYASGQQVRCIAEQN